MIIKILPRKIQEVCGRGKPSGLNLNLKEILTKLNENKVYNKPLESFKITEVILEDLSVTDPEEADKLAIKRIQQDKQSLSEPGVKDLIKLGFIPIAKQRKYVTRDDFGQRVQHDTDTPILGVGKQGKVYEVTKSGKRYAAKISEIDAGLETSREYSIRKKIESIRETLPPEVSNHIIKTFYIGISEDKKYYIYIMEMLDSLSDIEKDILYHDPSESLTFNHVKDFFNDLDNLYHLLSLNILEADDFYLYGLSREQVAALKQMMVDAIKTNIANAVATINFSEIQKKYERLSNGIIRTINVDFAQHLLDLISINNLAKKQFLYFKRDTGLQVNEFKSDLREIFTIALNDTNIRSGMFKHYDDAPIEKNAVKQVQELVAALRYLSTKHGLFWQDLHQDNVLMRRQTNELVAADIGLFKFIGGEKKASAVDSAEHPFGPKNATIGTRELSKSVSKGTANIRGPKKLKLEIRIKK